MSEFKRVSGKPVRLPSAVTPAIPPAYTFIEDNNKSEKKSDAAPTDTPSSTDQLKASLELAKQSGKIDGLNSDQKGKAIEILDLMLSQLEIAKSPDLGKDLVIEMDLMLGGRLKISAPTGYHVMQGKRQMKLMSEKGDSDEMLPAYIMAACSTINDEPVAMHDIQDKLTARDFNTALGFFQRINLL